MSQLVQIKSKKTTATKLPPDSYREHKEKCKNCTSSINCVEASKILLESAGWKPLVERKR